MASTQQNASSPTPPPRQCHPDHPPRPPRCPQAGTGFRYRRLRPEVDARLGPGRRYPRHRRRSTLRGSRHRGRRPLRRPLPANPPRTRCPPHDPAEFADPTYRPFSAPRGRHCPQLPFKRDGETRRALPPRRGRHRLGTRLGLANFPLWLRARANQAFLPRFVTVRSGCPSTDSAGGPGADRRRHEGRPCRVPSWRTSRQTSAHLRESTACKNRRNRGSRHASLGR